MQQDACEENDIEKTVVEYLRANPQFFENNNDLLLDLNIPHKTGATISLIERQVSLLRDQNRKLKKQLRDLLEIARDNDQINIRMHHMTMSLLKTSSMDEVLMTLRKILHDDFAADAVSARLFIDADKVTSSNADLCVDRSAPGLTPFAKVLKDGFPVCSHYKADQLQPLFGDEAEHIASVAFVPLGKPVWGLLSIGSHDHERFHPKKETTYLAKMGELINAFISQHVD
jgi:hypothetical protein